MFSLFFRVEEYQVEDENAQLASVAGNLLENNQDPKFANSKVNRVDMFSSVSYLRHWYM